MNKKRKVRRFKLTSKKTITLRAVFIALIFIINVKRINK